MNKFIIVLAVVLAFVAFPFANGAGCHGTASYGPENQHPINEGSSSMTLVKTTSKGKLYSVNVPQDGPDSAQTFHLVHLWGTAYEMGYAQGQLLKNEVNQFIPDVWAYMQSQVDAILTKVPLWLANAIATFGLDAALDATYYASVEFTPSHFYDELRGIADASGVNYNELVRVHMIAGLTQGDCSMLGAWGEALDPTSSTKLLQLRALDWDMNGPFRNFSQVTVYHPDDGHAFANVGMTGFIGGLTGVSSSQVGISEIGAAFPDSTFGSESRIGLPFIFLLRDILQFDKTIDDAIDRMVNTRRTCNLMLGVGDGKLAEFRGFQYSYSVLNIFDDQNLQPYNATWHPRIPGIVYWGMDWLCPSYNTVLSNLLLKYHGKITPELAIRSISAVEQSGDNHIAYYDLTNQQLWVSFAAPHGTAGNVAAYARQYTYFDLTTFWNESL